MICVLHISRFVSFIFSFLRGRGEHLKEVTVSLHVETLEGLALGVCIVRSFETVLAVCFVLCYTKQFRNVPVFFHDSIECGRPIPARERAHNTANDSFINILQLNKSPKNRALRTVGSFNAPARINKLTI